VPKQQPKPTKFHVGPIDCIPRRAVARVAGISGSQLLKIANRDSIPSRFIKSDFALAATERVSGERLIRRLFRIIFRDEIAIVDDAVGACNAIYRGMLQLLRQNVRVVDANVLVVLTFP